MAITIGAYEAQVIAMTLEGIIPKRPLTHDLLKNVIEGLGAKLLQVTIDQVVEDVFKAQLHLILNGDSQLQVDCRCSDALALALRSACPILIREELFVSHPIPAFSGKRFTNNRGNLDQFSLEELQSLLEDVLLKEDYESAEIIKKFIALKSST